MSYYIRNEQGKYLAKDGRFVRVTASRDYREGLRAFAREATANGHAARLTEKLAQSKDSAASVEVVAAATLDTDALDALVGNLASNIHAGTSKSILGAVQKFVDKTEKRIDDDMDAFLRAINGFERCDGHYLTRAAEKFVGHDVLLRRCVNSFKALMDSADQKGVPDSARCGMAVEWAKLTVAKLTDDLVELCGSPNSTCPWHNAERDAEARAKQALRSDLLHLTMEVSWRIRDAATAIVDAESKGPIELATRVKHAYAARYDEYFHMGLLYTGNEGDKP